MTVEEIRQLYEFNAWANHRAVEACAALSNEQFTKPLGSSFSSVRDTVVHILGSEWVWLERWHGRSPSRDETYREFASDRFPDLAAVRAQWPAVERRLADFTAGLQPADLERRIEYVNLAGNRFAYPLGSMLQHLVNHGTYHRGQVATLVRQLGAQPRATDFLRYLDWLAGQAED